MKTRFTAEVVSKGGRSGGVKSPERLRDSILGNTLDMGMENRGPNPGLLFAGAHSACYHGSLVNAAETLGAPVKEPTTRASVSLAEDDQGGCGLAVELHALLPEMVRNQAQRVMEEARRTCPYSEAFRGEASFALVLD